eukprot:327110_1
MANARVDDNKAQSEMSDEKQLHIDEALTQSELEQICLENQSITSLYLTLPYECSTVFNFDNMAFPELKELKMNCINLANGIDLQKSNFPKLLHLDLMNINFESDSCDFDFDLPKLKTLVIQHTNCENQKQFVQSIGKCVALESFSSYKFRVLGGMTQLGFPSATSITMMRAECMTSLSFWAPKLT